MPIDRFITPFAAPAAGNTGRAPGVWLAAQSNAMQRSRDLANQAALAEQNRRLAEESEARMAIAAQEEARLAEKTEYARQIDAFDAFGKLATVAQTSPEMATMLAQRHPGLGGMAGPPPQVAPPPPPPPSPMDLSTPEPTLDEVLAGVPMAPMDAPVDMVLDEDPTLTTEEMFAAKQFDMENAGAVHDLSQITQSVDPFGFGGIAAEAQMRQQAQREAAIENMADLALSYAGDPTLSPEGAATLRAKVGPLVGLMSTEDGAKFIQTEVKRIAAMEAKRKKMGSSKGGGLKRERTPQNWYGVKMGDLNIDRARKAAEREMGGSTERKQLRRQTESLAALLESKRLFGKRGAKWTIAQRQAIKQFIRQTDSRITDKDYSLIASGRGVWATVREWYAENLSPEAIDKRIDELDDAQLDRLALAVEGQIRKAQIDFNVSYDQNAKAREDYLHREKQAAESGQWETAAFFAEVGDTLEHLMARTYPTALVKQRRAALLKAQYGEAKKADD